MQLNRIVFKDPILLVNAKKRFVPLKMVSENGCLDFTPKKGLFPDWVYVVPDAVIKGMEKMPLPPNPYGFEFWCKIVAGMLTAGTGAAIGAGFAGWAGGSVGAVGGMAHGMHTGNIGGFDCDRIEADLAYQEICNEFNKEICPMLKYNLKKIRPITVGLEDPVTLITMPARRCPSCASQEVSQTRDLENLRNPTCDVANPIVPPMQIKVSSGETEVCTEFQFDLNTGQVSSHDCPKPFVEVEASQGLPDAVVSMPDGCEEYGFDWSIQIDDNEITPSTRDAICNLLKSNPSTECVPPGILNLPLQSLLPLKCF